MKRTSLIAAACTFVAAGALYNTADAREPFVHRAGPRNTIIMPTKQSDDSVLAAVSGKDEEDSVRIIHRAGPRNTIVMPTRKSDDETLVAASTDDK